MKVCSRRGQFGTGLRFGRDGVAVARGQSSAVIIEVGPINSILLVPNRNIESNGGFPTLAVVWIFPTGGSSVSVGKTHTQAGIFPHWFLFFTTPFGKLLRLRGFLAICAINLASSTVLTFLHSSVAPALSVGR